MIFDDMNSDASEAPRPQPQFHNPPANMRTSLDDFLSGKRSSPGSGRENRYYDVYHIQINRDFIADFKVLVKPESKAPVPGLTTRKQRLVVNDKTDCWDQARGMRHESFHSGPEQSDQSDHDDSSDESSITEFGVEQATAPPNKEEPGPGLKLSIDERLEIKETEDDGRREHLEVKSQELASCFKHLKHTLKRTRSLDDTAKPHKQESAVQLESFVSLDDIQRAKKPVNAEDDVCAICFSSYTVNTYIAKLRVCGHVFHKSCIDSWIGRPGCLDSKCPVCKRSL